MTVRLPHTEPTPLFDAEAGEHAEYLLTLVGTRPPTTRMLLDRHPANHDDATHQEATQCTG